MIVLRRLSSRPGPWLAVALLLPTLAPGALAGGLLFEANGGRYDPATHFVVRSPGVATHVLDDALVFGLLPPDPGALDAADEPAAVQGSLLRLAFEGGRAARVVGLDEQPTRIHHLIGRDPAGWSVDNRTYGGVLMEQVWPGVDVHVHERDGRLEWDLLLAPGVDPAGLSLRVDGAAVLPRTDGGLELVTPAGSLTQRAPVAWQVDGDARHPVSVRATLGADGRLGFDVGALDPGLPLVIDPVMVYATFVDGSGWDELIDVAVGADGSALVAGWARSTDMPTSPGALQSELGDGWVGWTSNHDGYLAAVAPGGDTLLWATYLGGGTAGTGCCITGADKLLAVALADDGSPVVGGWTRSPDFPTTPGAWIGSVQPGMLSGFVARLTPGGSGLTWSTLVGDDNHEADVRALALDGEQVVVTGKARWEFPTTPGALQALGNQGVAPYENAFLVRLLADGSAPVFATLLGGGHEAGEALAIDSQGRHHLVCGSGGGSVMPIVDGLQPVAAGGSETYLARVSADGSTLQYATWLGGSGHEGHEGDWTVPRLALDGDDRVWITSMTHSADFPTTVGALQAATPVTTPYGYAGTLTCVDTSQVGVAGLVHSTYYGGTGKVLLSDLALDAEGRPHVVGLADCAVPLMDPWQASLQTLNQGGLLAVFEPDGSLLRATYFGQGVGVRFPPGPRLALDPVGNVFVAGVGELSADFATPGAFQEQPAGSTQGFVARFATAATGTWVDEGASKGGPSGTPHLEGLGSLLIGTQASLTLTSGPPGGLASLVYGLSAAYLPCQGGLLVPFHDVVQGGLVLDGAGGLQELITWPGAATGIQLWVQAWMPDAQVPSGWVASNALRVTAP